MPDNPGYPREAKIVEVTKGDSSQGVVSFELRGVTPDAGLLLSEHPSMEDALEAKRRYEDESLE
ncbi:YaiA family protein [Halotalea alkalilenta]|uniref:Uncharacterized protein n=1 Tax=Halotalea alkalilenta TaxID=376489 RepID=A0A172YFP5_9GAMM|nr:YaiA family protein [Halotalea alkalilenta]ANF58053.1 hypothetical protein A5892_11730 [Halotalea alkalilenta]